MPCSLFDQGNLSRPQPVAITMAPKKHDPLLRFYDMCPAYMQNEVDTLRWMVGRGGGTL